MGRSDALIEILSRTIVRSQNTCLSIAENSFLLEINKVRNVNINAMDIMQYAKSESICAQDIEVDAGSLEFDVDRVIRATIQASEADGSAVFDLKNKIKHVFVTEDVRACLADAKNSYSAQFDVITGDYKADGADLKQIATSTIQRCMQEGKFKVGDVSLPNYLDTALEANPEIRIIIPSETEPICDNAKYMYYGFAGSAAVAVTIIIVLLLWHRFKPITK